MNSSMIHFIKYIRNEIKNKDNAYDEYIHAFEEYEAYLNQQLQSNGDDLDAICQLAAVWLSMRHDTYDCIKLLDDFLPGHESTLSDSQKSRVYTNLAYYHWDNHDQKQFCTYARKAICLHSENPGLFNALGICLSDQGNNSEALTYFNYSSKLSDDLQFLYNKAVCLYRLKNYTEAEKAFQSILTYYPDHDRSLYGLAACNLQTHENEKALLIAEVLLSRENDDIDEFYIADLFFACGLYGRYQEIIDGAKYQYEYNEWLASYFYSMHHNGNDTELNELYQDIINSVNENIKTAEEERDEDYLNYTIEIKEQVVHAYKEAVIQNRTPEINIQPYFIPEGCFLEDCPRHQVVE